MINNIIKTSAPANVMLMGEHAVLYGHDAIVCALSQRIHVTLSPRTDNKITITSALANFDTTLADVANVEHPKKLSFVLASIVAVLPSQGFDLNITSEFSHLVGLGSSAAVTASCVYALLIFKNDNAQSINLDKQKVFDIGLSVIHAVQKRGSGSDLAASVFGGLVAYKAFPKEQRAIKQLLADTENVSTQFPRINLFYAGYKTPTTEVLSIVAAKAEKYPTIYESIYAHMQQATEQAKQAIIKQDWHMLGDMMNLYHGLMDALGVSDAKMSELVYRERAKAAVYGAKISGSGLGDCIISLSDGNVDVPTASSADAVSAQLTLQGILHHV